MKLKDLETARVLYKPTPMAEALVLNIIDLFETKKINNLTFQRPYQIGECIVRLLEMEDSFCGLLIHWEPNYKLSTHSDPFCSAFMLDETELMDLYTEIQKLIA